MSKMVKIKQTRKEKRELKKREKQSILPTWAEFAAEQCSHCGGAHLRACPRIKRMVFHTSGGLSEIEFWGDGEWDTTNVLWPESIVDAGDA